MNNWLPGAHKPQGQAKLGADWPGKAVDSTAEAKPERKNKRKNRIKRQ